MSAPLSPTVSQRAQSLLEVMGERRLLPAQRADPQLDSAEAARTLMAIEALREARGEHRRGYKIGFTNRTIWPLYDIYSPIWGPVYDSTLKMCDDSIATVDPRLYVQPRLEPEIVFGIRAIPASSQVGDLLAAIDWYAHGYEIVQCPYPNWRMSAAEAQAAQGLHGALRVGVRRPISALSDPVEQLAALRIELSCNGRAVAHGVGRDVLDSPVLAVVHLAEQLASHGRHLLPGEIITTGTLTDAQPLLAGQHWASSFDDDRLSGMVLHTDDNAALK